MTALINRLNAAADIAPNGQGGFAILHGTLAPEGCVVRLQGFSSLVFDGSARVFTSAADALMAISAGRIRSSDILIIRHEDRDADMTMVSDLPAIATALEAHGLDRVTLITDGRVSADTSGAIIGHVTPSAAAGGAIAYVQDDDIIHVDIAGRRIDVLADIDIRRGVRAKSRKSFGAMEKYARLVTSVAAAE